MKKFQLIERQHKIINLGIGHIFVTDFAISTFNAKLTHEAINLIASLYMINYFYISA